MPDLKELYNLPAGLVARACDRPGLVSDPLDIMLRAIKEDLLDSRQWLETERAYRIAARASDHALLKAIAAGRYAEVRNPTCSTTPTTFRR
jgi:hypothetical protein